MPHNLEAEVAAIGSALLDPKYLPRVARIVRPEDFYQDAHQIVFRTMLALQKEMKGLDVLTIADRLEQDGNLDKIGGSGYLASMYNQTPIASNAEHYAKIVRRDSVNRQLIIAGHEIAEIGQASDENPKNALSKAIKRILGIDAQKTSESHSVGTILKEYEGLQEQYAEAARRGKTILGDTTGFRTLDEMTQGFREHHIWMIGGYTSVGKTYFSLNLVRWLLEQNKRIVFYSLEMSKVDLISRLMAILTEMPSLYILRGLMTKDEKFSYDLAKTFLESCDFKIYSEMHDLDQIKLSMLEEHMEKPVDCFFLDYVQLVTRTGKEYEDMRAAATEFQELMGELKTPMVMLTQINNEAAKSPNAWTSGAKGASNLIQAADYYTELWPGEQDMDIYQRNLKDGIPVRVKVKVKKNRHGRTGAIDMFFSSYTGVFKEETV